MFLFGAKIQLNKQLFEFQFIIKTVLSTVVSLTTNFFTHLFYDGTNKALTNLKLFRDESVTLHLWGVTFLILLINFQISKYLTRYPAPVLVNQSQVIFHWF
nr:MAG TPA: hypothetical protein [Caudoviricetes sp.]